MIPTPDLSHLKAEDYDRVYEPAEDTFLLLDALEADQELLKALKPSICLEVGSGSGCVSSFLGSILKDTTLYLCTDLNPHACVCTSRTGSQNRVALNPINTSFMEGLGQRLHRSIDVLLFNPPYVPTVEEEAAQAQDGRDIQGSWAGGNDGMDVTNRFLGLVDDMLSERGVLYLVALKQNNLPEIQERMKAHYGLEGEVALQRRAGREHLFILRFRRSQQTLCKDP
ncbi:putative methylase [Cylindrobasidium torrendii FP15055 ss-10]|uniref:Putative methylase n=1 Tax=Cylindrobasidium torrendii FP15055 ss-10 TaxID=1314674 RepID=A0A0D7BDF5_9AGAR|nr:putative methylase [Cylindrobasidium torrendii FP15055 ss-10]